MRTLTAAFVLWVLAFVPAGVAPSFAQGPGQGTLPLGDPAPRNPDGRIHLGPQSGENGIWLPRDAQFVIDVADRVDRQVGPQFPDRPMSADVPFQPWARALYEFRLLNEFEPHTRCKPSGGERQFFTPYGVEFIEIPDQQLIYILDIGGSPHLSHHLHGWPASSAGSGTHLLRAFRRPLGKRHARRRHGRFQRTILDGPGGTPAYRTAPGCRTIYAHGHERRRIQGDHRRSGRIHRTLVDGAST